MREIVTQIPAQSEVLPVLITREKYYALLKAARIAGNEWIYYLIKVFCCLGLPVSELHLLTIDALVAGRITIADKLKPYTIRIPEILRVELLTYAFRNNINSGSLFKSPNGCSLTRSLITKELVSLCGIAGLSSENVTPKNLRMLYYSARFNIRSKSSLQVEKEYASILKDEDSMIGWDNIAV